MTDNTKRSGNEAMDDFTHAVKTIVNVPKNAVSPKPKVRKIDDKYEEVECLDCGMKIIRPNLDNHHHDPPK